MKIFKFRKIEENPGQILKILENPLEKSWKPPPIFPHLENWNWEKRWKISPPKTKNQIKNYKNLKRHLLDSSWSMNKYKAQPRPKSRKKFPFFQATNFFRFSSLNFFHFANFSFDSHNIAWNFFIEFFIIFLIIFILFKKLEAQ